MILSNLQKGTEVEVEYVWQTLNALQNWLKHVQHDLNRFLLVRHVKVSQK